MPKDLVFEIGTEEMPAAAVDLAVGQLKKNAGKFFEENRLSFGHLTTMGTPRRLVLLVSDLAQRQKELMREVKGPAKKAAYDENGQPTPAALGFARGHGIDVDTLVVKKIEEHEYVFALIEEKGLPATKVLQNILPQLILSITFPKSMRWNNGDLQFVRPVRWLLALLGTLKIPISLGELKSDNLTWGHRFLAKNPIKVESSSDYMKAMAKGKVLVDNVKRAQKIRDDAEKAACEVGGRAVIHSHTFAEVVQLVEYPHVIYGSFSKDYVMLPRDVLITSMESHQRYFPIENNKGKLLPFFLVVHNGDPKHNDLIQRGHERVLQARLADAKFFFQEDQKEPLAKKVEKLKGVVFQEKLGTVYDKTVRVQSMAEAIARELGCSATVIENVKRAAFLSKADLVTEMVIEFPTLQGVMGREYALLSGEKQAVSQAIFEHYLPRFADDSLPESLEGKILSMADKIDSIVGCFAIGLLPSGSEDPYALRRQAQGILNIIMEDQFSFSLVGLLDVALKQYRKAKLDLRSAQETKNDLEDFFKSRLRGQFLNEDFAYDVIDAILAPGIDQPTDARQRIEAITRLRESSQMEDVIVAYTRCNNLAQLNLGTNVSRALLQEKEEEELLELVTKQAVLIEKNVGNKDYNAAIKNLATMRPTIDRFFDKVLVMAKEKKIKENRLALLNKCVTSFLRVADFSKLVVPGNERKP